MNNQFAVIGLGLFGSALCEELQLQNAEVLAIDIDESKTRQIATLCNHVIVADATDEATVAELGLANFDIVFVAIGDSHNDLEMVAYAGTGVAIEGGVPELLALADLVVPTPEQAGLVVAFERLGLIDSPVRAA